MVGVLYFECLTIIVLMSLLFYISKKSIVFLWFCTIYLVVFPLSGLYLYYTGDYSPVGQPYWENENAYLYSSVLSLSSIVLVFVSYYISLCFFKIKFDSVDLLYKKSNNLFYIIMASFSLLTLFLLFQKYGGFFNFIQNINSYRSGGGVGAGFLQYPATMLLPTILFFHMATNPNAKNFGKFYILFFALSLIPLIILGFRGPVVIITLQFSFFYHHFISKIGFKKIAVYSLLLFLILLTWGYLREARDSTSFSFIVLFELAISVVIFRTRGIEVLSAIVSRPEKIDYNYFLANLVESFTSFIPRAIYAAKDISTTEKITTIYFSNDLFSIGIIKEIYGGVSSTFLGHAYWSAGALGVIIVSIVTGVIIGVVQNLYSYSRGNTIVIFFVGMFFSYIHFYIESFQLAINAFIMNILMFSVFFFILPKRVKNDF
ncbi:O-antigen polymerase [Shewanella fidelis]|uniref:O-antigen ligase n=1 Tax=Shewanella fidelis TaxID=173509 RepID=A0AAW8NNT6_9GAMM|nr:O-antigen polymerase [Shewanella fidelis]MDR8524425.1 O-antigen ligase [Shewanella fidelis]MDW4811901.1 O-antigen ligase [Shewanella fidelis]MDW4817160.1 O-antigen ligase [Shewanella fidelis]MDW4821230.1 O-antigen ligase [Shewanella fidelis]MDW4822507.1 O-antigen ligase [Shewanella fidelis]